MNNQIYSVASRDAQRHGPLAHGIAQGPGEVLEFLHHHGALLLRVSRLQRGDREAQAGPVRAPGRDGDGQAHDAGGGFLVLERIPLLPDDA